MGKKEINRKEKEMKKTVVAVMMVALLAAAGLAIAQGYEKGPGMEMGCGPRMGMGHGPGMWHALNLTPEQTQKLQALRESFFKETIPLRNDLMSKKLELRSLWLKTNPDEAQILAKQKEINDLRAQLQEKATQNRLEMRKVLTPEQQAQLANLRGRSWHEFGRRCGYGPGRGRGMGMGMGMGPGPGW
jgi:Spy/CpxP family protein refolding chaperone